MGIWYIDLWQYNATTFMFFSAKQSHIEVGDKLSRSSTNGKCWGPWMCGTSGGSVHLYGWRWCSNIPKKVAIHENSIIWIKNLRVFVGRELRCTWDCTYLSSKTCGNYHMFFPSGIFGCLAKLVFWTLDVKSLRAQRRNSEPEVQQSKVRQWMVFLWFQVDRISMVVSGSCNRWDR